MGCLKCILLAVLQGEVPYIIDTRGGATGPSALGHESPTGGGIVPTREFKRLNQKLDFLFSDDPAPAIPDKNHLIREGIR